MKRFEARIKIQTVSNPEKRIYHLTAEISSYCEMRFQRPFHNYFEEVGELGASILQEVFAIPGVDMVFIKPYELSVTKGMAFNWDEIEPEVLEALKKCFQKNERVEITFNEEDEA